MVIQHTDTLSYLPSCIVSLVPSQTELLWYLGLENATAGITRFCIHPPHWQQTKTIVGGTKNVNTEKVIELKPNLVIANKEENNKEQVAAIAEKCPVLVTNVNNLEDATTMIKTIGKLTGTIAKATLLANEIQDCFRRITPLTTPVKACYLIWKNPCMTVGGDTFINDMLVRCGFINIFSNSKRYPVITIEALQQLDCELLLLSSEPYPFKEKDLMDFQQLLPSTKIMLVDGEMFSWYGSRLLKAADYFKHLAKQVKDALP